MRLNMRIPRTAIFAASLLLLLLLFLLLARPGVPALARTPRAVSAGVPVRVAYMTQTATSAASVWIANGNGSERKRLGPGGQPLIAPDGEAVAASLFSDEPGPQLTIYPAAGGPAVRYFDTTTETAEPVAWSADSRYLAVSLQSTALTDVGAHSGLAVIDTVMGTVQTIAQGVIYGASFDPEGSDRIAYASAPSTLLEAPVNVYESGPEGAGLLRLTGDGRSLDPVWGPRYIAYNHERLRPGNAPIYQIWLIPPGGGRARRLTNMNVPSLVVGLVPLAFSADGSRLLAEFEGQDTSEAWTVRVPSGRALRVTSHGLPVTAAGISRSGNTVLVNEGFFEEPASTGRVAEIPFGGGRAKVLVSHGSQASWNG